LDRWADTNDAKSYLPELIRRLVHATVEPTELERVNFPAAEETHRPGYDGQTKAIRGNAKVPAGIAFWEMGADQNVKSKLDKDYEKRTEGRGEGDFSKVTYIAVTPRDYQNKSTWEEEKKAENKWADVRVYDSNDLEQWLEMAPGVALWLATYIKLKGPLKGLEDLSTRWKNIQEALLRPLPPSILLISRESTAEQFVRWQSAPPSILSIRGPSPQEVVDVFTAWVESLPPAEQSEKASRAIIVHDAEVWSNLLDSEQRLILVCSERIEIIEDLLVEARRKGHHVLCPITTVHASQDNIHRIERFSRHDLEKELVKAGISEPEAHSLAQQSAGSFTVLRRRYSSVPLISTPPWGREAEAIKLAPLLLAGAWRDKQKSDSEIVAELAATPYEDARKVLSQWHQQADSPVRWADGVWEFVAPHDTWSFVRTIISPTLLDRFEAVAVKVLGENDPRLELPREERWQAGIQNKVLTYSGELRKGLVQTLAVLGTRPTSEQITDTTSLQTRVDNIVRRVLPPGSAWHKWASLGDLLTLLAEAAPEPFLSAAEAGVKGDSPELAKLFLEETRGFPGRAEHTGLLWALERLAWPAQYLGRVASILAKLAQHDPGGQWANRPDASLRDIFFSLMPHTAATPSQRIEVISMILRRFPEVGWKLLLGLLPQGPSMIMYKSTPEWRTWAEGWRREVSDSDIEETITGLLGLLFKNAGENVERWNSLIPRLPDLPKEDFKKALLALESIGGRIAESHRRTIWNKLRELITRHKRFQKANWALPQEAIALLENAEKVFEPKDPVSLAIPLFMHGFEVVEERELPWKEQTAILRDRRRKAIHPVLEKLGLPGLLEIAPQVQDPWAVGVALADATAPAFDSNVLPHLLLNENKAIRMLATAYSACRISQGGLEWVKAAVSKEWPHSAVGAFGSLLPFDATTWNYFESHGPTVSAEYWKQVNVVGSSTLESDDLDRAVSSLLAVGRPHSVLGLLASFERGSKKLAPERLLELFEAALTTSPQEAPGDVDRYHLQEVLKELQQSKVDDSRLARIEWNLLPILGPHTLPPATLHKHLAESPEFFIEIITLLYKSRKEDPSNEKAKTEEIPSDNTQKRVVDHAWRLLHDWRRVPGKQPDGTIDAKQLLDWVAAVRTKAKEVDRLEVSDITIGQVLAYAPAEADGSWPCIPVREVIENVESSELERGLVTGVLNKRGVVSKALYEGGKQEHDLAAQYEGFASKCQASWPRTSAALRIIVRSYEEDARREDAEAEADRR